MSAFPILDTNLKNCPFCEGKAEWHNDSQPDDAGRFSFSIFCSNCGAIIESGYASVALEKWQSRPEPYSEKIKRAVKEAAAELKKLSKEELLEEMSKHDVEADGTYFDVPDELSELDEWKSKAEEMVEWKSKAEAVLTQANSTIATHFTKLQKKKELFKSAYLAACKHLGCNGYHPNDPQFLQDMLLDLEMWEYEDDSEDTCEQLGAAASSLEKECEKSLAEHSVELMEEKPNLEE